MNSKYLLLILLFSSACGGSGSDGGNEGTTQAQVKFGGAACESGLSLRATSPQGYDILYSFDFQPNPPASFVLDPSSTATECGKVLNEKEVFPWVRVDQASLENPDELDFQLLMPGGRNAPVLLSTPISNPEAQSVRGGFAYKVQYDFIDGASDEIVMDCDVQYDGSYCPFFTPNSQSIPTPNAAFHFSAEGGIECRVRHSDGRPETRCGGTFQARNSTLDAGYYGE